MATPQSVVYSATVAGGSSPTGSVSFVSGTQALCTATLSNGTASCVGPLGPSSSILASYSGDAANAPSWASVSNPYGPTRIFAQAGSGQWCWVGKLCAGNFVAGVTNSSGTPVPGVVVTFSAPKSGATGTFQGPTSVTTNSSGLAGSPPFKVNSKQGTYAVTATAAGVSGAAQFTVTNYKW